MACSRSSTARCSGVCSGSMTLALPAAGGAEGGAQPVSQRLRVEVGHLGKGGELGLQVAAQPGHGGELQPVGLLVQADPHPEIAGRDIELLLDLGDVGSDQQQAAPAGSAPRTAAAPKTSYWPSTLLDR